MSFAEQLGEGSAMLPFALWRELVAERGEPTEV
jgi:hypothetical protein